MKVGEQLVLTEENNRLRFEGVPMDAPFDLESRLTSADGLRRVYLLHKPYSTVRPSLYVLVKRLRVIDATSVKAEVIRVVEPGANWQAVKRRLSAQMRAVLNGQHQDVVAQIPVHVATKLPWLDNATASKPKEGLLCLVWHEIYGAQLARYQPEVKVWHTDTRGPLVDHAVTHYVVITEPEE